MSGRLTVIAIGGNSLIDPRLPPTIANQYAVAARAMVPIADFIEAGTVHDRIVLTHGNGPQVGFKALANEISREVVHEVPLDTIVADTQGSIGYMVQRALREELRRRGLGYTVVAVVTEVEVDLHDQAFQAPTKPIGRFYTEAEATTLRKERGWPMMEDSHRGWRRAVPSPAPVRIVQLDVIDKLTEWGAIVVACGGGGIPVVRHDDGSIGGIEGVIDKDRASALLGARMGAQQLVISTAVEGVYRNFGQPDQELLREVNLATIQAMAAEGQFPAGSMGPKIKAAERFLLGGGQEVIICSPGDLVAAVNGEKGTRIRR